MVDKTLVVKDKNNETAYEDILEDANAENPYLFVLSEEEVQLLAYCLENIPSREAEIIKKRYSIDGIRRYSLKELNKECNLTKEHICQLECRRICLMKAMVQDIRSLLSSNVGLIINVMIGKVLIL